jgi:hypothetical protein
LGDFVIQIKHISHLKMDPNAFDPKSEVTVDANATHLASLIREE